MKRNYWPLFFIGIFSFTFSMIIWTIYSAVQVPVNEDDTFLKSYQDVDNNFNKIIISNKQFLKNYNFKIMLNKKELDLGTKDIFLSQRAIEKKSTHKNILHEGKNSVKVLISDKKGNFIKNVMINFRVTKATNNSNIIDVKDDGFKKESNSYTTSINIPKKGNWNIIATFEIENSKGYLFIKTNAI